MSCNLYDNSLDSKTMKIQQALQKIIDRKDLTSDEMRTIMQAIMNNEVTPTQIGAFLMGLHMKGETPAEIASAARVARELSIPVNVQGNHIVDIVGTGGDSARTFNISTACAFVAAAAGAKVAKHNNRAISSASGSADLLEIAGININLNPEQIADCIEKIGVGFMFAPLHHLAWKNVSAPRRELGVRTLFNVLGPLANPANASNLLVGVFSKQLVEVFAEVFQQLGNNHVLVVHSEDGLDEISIAAPTFVAELKNNKISTYTINPKQFGIAISPLDSLRVSNAQESLAIIQKVLNNETGPARDIVTLNAGAAIYAANLVDDLVAGIKKAAEVIASGAAKDRFQNLIQLTQSFRRVD